jgi:hypothetical protein
MFFQRKKKSRIEKAREDFGKQIRVVNKQAKQTRKEFSKQLNNTAEDLRSNWSQFMHRDEIQRANEVAAELERIARDVEGRAEKGIGEVTASARQNVWLSVLIAFAIGIFAGLIVKELLDD